MTNFNGNLYNFDCKQSNFLTWNSLQASFYLTIRLSKTLSETEFPQYSLFPQTHKILWKLESHRNHKTRRNCYSAQRYVKKRLEEVNEVEEAS